MTRDQWLRERTAFAEAEIADRPNDRDGRLIWTGYRDAYKHCAEAAPRWDPEPEPTILENLGCSDD